MRSMIHLLHTWYNLRSSTLAHSYIHPWPTLFWLFDSCSCLSPRLPLQWDDHHRILYPLYIYSFLPAYDLALPLHRILISLFAYWLKRSKNLIISLLTLPGDCSHTVKGSNKKLRPPLREIKRSYIHCAYISHDRPTVRLGLWGILSLPLLCRIRPTY